MCQRSTIGDLLRVLRDNADRVVWVRLAGAVALVTVGSLLAALAPLALKGMVDVVASASRQEQAPQALLLGAAYLIALGSGRALSELRPLLTGTAEQRLLARLTQNFFAHILALPLQFHLGRRAGELLHSIHLATTGYQLLTTHVVNSLVPVVVEIATVTVVLLHLAQPALVATFAVTAIAYLLLFVFGSLKLSAHAHRLTGASLNVNATLTDALLNCEALKCFVAEPTARQKLTASTDELERRWRSLYGVRVRLGLAVTTTFTASIAASLWFAAEAVSEGSLTIGGFVLANVYMLQIVRPLEVLGSAARDVAEGVGFIRPLLSILEEPTEYRFLGSRPGVDQGTASPAARSPSIRFERVCFGYDPERPVFRSLSLDVGAGKNLAIVGASGSGKSSLARLLLGLYEPQAGRILLNDQPMNVMPLDEVRTLIGLVPQDTVLFNDTLANNIGLGRAGASRGEIELAAGRAQLHDLIASLPQGYETLVGERGLKLSGGERQRVAIARVLLKAPQVFVFDEATSMLDSRTEADILRNLRSISQGCTTITIAHRLSTVMRADEIVVLDKGLIVEQGTHADLVARDGAYATLWRRQLHGDHPS